MNIDVRRLIEVPQPPTIRTEDGRELILIGTITKEVPVNVTAGEEPTSTVVVEVELPIYALGPAPKRPPRDALQ